MCGKSYILYMIPEAAVAAVTPAEIARASDLFDVCNLCLQYSGNTDDMLSPDSQTTPP